MRPDIEKAKMLGPLVKTNTFDTEKGKYRIDLREYRKHIYFFKYRDGQLMEACDLNTKTVLEEPDGGTDNSIT